MNNLRLLGMLILSVFFLSPVNNPVENNLEKGLIAYYSFNECDARDDSGNGSDGKLYGNVGCWCGIEDDGLLFGGQRDYVEFYGMVNRYFTTSDLTVSFYFKSTQYSVFKQSMLSKRENCEDFNAFDFSFDQNFKRVVIGFNENPNKDYGDISPETGGNGWKHVAIVRNGFKAYTYINGELIREGRRCSGVDITNDAVLSFSNSPCIYEGAQSRFKGVLDELRVYDRPLSDQEIMELYLLNPVEKADQDCVT